MPDYTLVLKTFANYRKMTPDDEALVALLRGMNESQREMLREALGPPAKAKVKAVATRKIEHCAACDYTKRAAVHKDENATGYHVFQSTKQTMTVAEATKKSARAFSLAEKIAGTAGGNHKPLLCSYEIDGKVCHGEEEDGIHDKSLGYGNYHPFVSSSSAPSAVAQSSTSGSEASSGTGLVDVSSAVGG